MVGVSQNIKGNTFVNRSVGGLRKHYKIGQILGQGGFGEVRKCRHIVTGEERAVKYLDKTKLSAEETNLIFNEVDILSKMDHPNVVRLYEFFEEERNYCLV